jgi:HEAT repeat protein
MENRDMETDRQYSHHPQARLFLLGDTSVGVAELFPMVWMAAEMLTGPNAILRREALVQLEHAGVVRLSPLAATLVASRMDDPDTEVRIKALQIIGDALAPDLQGRLLPEAVRSHLSFYLSALRTRKIYALLQSLAQHPELEMQTGRILNLNPYAGNHLLEIANSRKAPLEVRRRALRMIGRVGYVDALPALERIQARLESRLNGQQAMPIAPPLGVDDSALLPDVLEVLSALRSP